MNVDDRLEEFKIIWDSSSKEERLAFLNRFASHLDPLSLQTISHTKADRLRRGILLALVKIFEGEWDGGDL